MYRVSLVLVLAATAQVAPQAAPQAAKHVEGDYPDFIASLYTAPTSSCDVMAQPWGAKGDGVTDDTAALQRCIHTCPRGPAGTFAVVLKKGHSFVTGVLTSVSSVSVSVSVSVDYNIARMTTPLRSALQVPPCTDGQ